MVETDQQVEGGRDCGVLAVPHGRRKHLLHDAPFGHRRVRVRWRKRVWRCAEPACPVVTFSETHPLAAPRALLTERAVVWAADALTDDDTTVNALAPRGVFELHQGLSDRRVREEALQGAERHVRDLGPADLVRLPSERGLAADG